MYWMTLLAQAYGLPGTPVWGVGTVPSERFPRLWSEEERASDISLETIQSCAAARGVSDAVELLASIAR